MTRIMRNATAVLFALLPLAIVGIWPTRSGAVTRNWNAGDGNWSEPSNWAPIGAPVTGDVVSIGFIDGLARTINYDYAGPLTALASLGLDLTGPGTDAATLSISTATSLNSNVAYIGYNGRGAVIQSAGTNNVSTALYLGDNAGSSGNYDLSGPGVLAVTGNQLIGNAGTGALNVSSGGHASNADANLGILSGSSGSATVDGPGSQWINSSVLAVGIAGTGSLGITSGGFVSSVNGRIGRDSGTGSAVVSGPSSRWQMTGDLSVGALAGAGTGTLSIQDQGTVHVGNLLSINAASNVNLDGGTLRFNTVSGVDRLNYTAGTIQLGGNRIIDNITPTNVDPIIQSLFGFSPSIPTGKRLVVESVTDISGYFAVHGGGFETLELYVAETDDAEYEFANLLIADGGSMKANSASVDRGNAGKPATTITVRGAGSKLTIFTLSFGSSAFSFNDFDTLNIEDQALVDVTIFYHYQRGCINLNGGTLRLTGYGDFGGDDFSPFNFNAGTLQFTGDREVGTDANMIPLVGAVPTITANKNLTIEGVATLRTTVMIDGGVFSVGGLQGASHLVFQRGTLSVTNQAMTIGASGPLGSTLELRDDMTMNVSLGTTNTGVVTGDGQIGGTFTNAAGGELRGEAGKSLTMTGTGNTNDGRMKLSGGEINFTGDLTNNVAGTITGNGSLTAAGGLTNFGTMNFAGTANIDGPVTNAAGGKITSAGGGATIFYDDVVNDGEIRTSTNGFSVFFGGVAGSGSFTGTGTVNFEGGVSPGSSPVALNVAGDVAFGADATLTIELGGTAAGTEHDKLNVAGVLSLDGALIVSLVDGFMPSAGQLFNILDWSNLSGTFASLTLPALGSGLAWNTSALYTTGALSVANAGIPGDYNSNGIVDAADYVLWRKGGPLANEVDTPGIVNEADYTAWRTRFGNSGPGPGAGAGDARTATGVPEPTSLVVLLVIGFPTAGFRRRRAAFR